MVLDHFTFHTNVINSFRSKCMAGMNLASEENRKCFFDCLLEPQTSK